MEQEGSLINWQAYDGRSALHLAVATGSVEVVRFLVGREDCDVDILDNTFCTPLHWAAKKGFSEKVDVLLSARAFHTSADDNGATALHYAANNNHADLLGHVPLAHSHPRYSFLANISTPKPHSPFEPTWLIRSLSNCSSSYYKFMLVGL
ncbi:inversin [Trichonephila clavipes]|nr:inversin [Trichonephila clavipes]